MKSRMPSRQLPPLSTQGIGSTNNNNGSSSTYVSRRQRNNGQNNNAYNQQQAVDSRNYNSTSGYRNTNSHHGQTSKDAMEASTSLVQGDGLTYHEFGHKQHAHASHFHLPHLRPTSSAASKGDFMTGEKGQSRYSDDCSLSPGSAIKLFGDCLTPYELDEIHSYKNVYFLGQNANKKPGISGAPNNDGFDDDQGSYIQTPQDHICYRYEVISRL